MSVVEPADALEFVPIVAPGVEVAAQYDPSWDYEPEPDPQEGLRVVRGGVVEFATKLARDLGLPPPVVYLSGPFETDDHVARFVDGTQSVQPVVILAWDPLSGLLFSEQVDEAATSIAHELGHAYLRSTGRTYDPAEEDLVEEFGRRAWEQGEQVGVAWLLKQVLLT